MHEVRAGEGLVPAGHVMQKAIDSLRKVPVSHAMHFCAEEFIIWYSKPAAQVQLRRHKPVKAFGGQERQAVAPGLGINFPPSHAIQKVPFRPPGPNVPGGQHTFDSISLLEHS